MMKRVLKTMGSRITGLVLLAGIAMTVPTIALAQRDQRDQRNDNNTNNVASNTRNNRNTLASGTVIPVRLDDEISSKNSNRGDSFGATVIQGPDDAGLPQGTRLMGTVQEVTASSKGRPGSVDVDFRRMIFPDGQSINMNGSLYSLSGKAVQSIDGRLVATNDKNKDKLKFIGIGAGAGLLIGTITKNNSILSSLLGAGAGYLYSEYGNKSKPGDVDLKRGQEFGVRLDSQLAFSGSNVRNTSQNNNQNSNDNRYYKNGNNGKNGNYGNRNNYNNGSNYNDHVRVLVNDKPVRFNSANRPYIRNGAVFLPISTMGNAAMFDYRWDARSRTIYARNNEVHMTMGSRSAVVSGDRYTLPSMAEQHNGVTFVPVQFIAWAANDDVSYDEASGTVKFTSSTIQR